MLYYATLSTPLGDMLALAQDHALCGLWFEGQKYFPGQKEEWMPDPGHPLFEELRVRLSAYFDGRRQSFDLPISPEGTVFQSQVWKLLLAIPPGQTRSYGALAFELAELRGGVKPSAQAVGGAVGHNPISILIPCHRVIGSDGSLTGYAGGLARKASLLALEKFGSLPSPG